MAVCNQLQDGNHVVFTYIDQWEKHSIGKIQFVAQKARNDLMELFSKQHQEINNLVKMRDEHVETSDTNMNDLKRWTRKVHQLRNEISELSSNTHLIHWKSVSPIFMIGISHKNRGVTPQKEVENEINVPGTRMLTIAMLNNQSPKAQKQMLGERLFVLIQQIEPRLAAKITGMFLEFDVKHILILMKSPAKLKTKIEDALNVLRVHQYQQRHVNNGRSKFVWTYS